MTRPTGTIHRFRRVRAGVLAVALVGLAACGSDDDGGDAATGSSTSSASSPSETASGAPGGGAPSGGATDAVQTLEVTSVDFDFELPSTELAAGDYTLELTNDGSSTHDLVVERDGEDVAETEDIGPGQSSTVTVTLEPGEYVFYCSIGNHRGMGMEVTVTVT